MTSANEMFREAMRRHDDRRDRAAVLIARGIPGDYYSLMSRYQMSVAPERVRAVMDSLFWEVDGT